MTSEQFTPNRQVGQVGGGQFKVADAPVLSDEQMEFVAKDGLFLRAAMPEGGPSDLPFDAGMGHVIKLDHRNRKAINDAVRILRAVKDLQDGLAQEVDDRRQITAAAIEAAPFRLMGEEVAMFTPVAEQDRFLIPAAAFADNRHGDQFRIRAGRRGAWARDLRSERSEQIADQDVHPGAQVVKIGYHRSHLGWLKGL